MFRYAFLALATLCVLAGSGAVSSVQSASQGEAPPLTRTVVLDGLEGPWDLAFTPDGALLFTEKCRGLSVRRADGTRHWLFGRAGAAVAAPDFFCQGQSGAHGIAVDPAFAQNRLVYLYMPSTLTRPPTNRVVRLVVEPGYTGVRARTDIVTDIPFKHVANAVGGAGAHSGGRLRFGPEGFLYITTGDNHQPTLPQDLTRLGGKVLRVDREGRPAPGNQTPAGGDPRIYTYGHRNVQGLAFQPGTGQPVVAEHGPNHTDEVTLLVAGGNGGWDPQQRPALRCPDGYCGYAGTAITMPMTDTTRFPEAMRPRWTAEGRSAGLGPCTFLTGAPWGAWAGRLAVGFLAGQRVEVLDLDASDRALHPTRMDLPRNRIRALVSDPTGVLYIAVDEGAIWRVAPQGP
ncbi:MAG: sorbosone dehydrogenase family protein [Candidatus Tectimicrobiota bacterium]